MVCSFFISSLSFCKSCSAEIAMLWTGLVEEAIWKSELNICMSSCALVIQISSTCVNVERSRHRHLGSIIDANESEPNTGQKIAAGRVRSDASVAIPIERQFLRAESYPCSWNDWPIFSAQGRNFAGKTTWRIFYNYTFFHWPNFTADFM